MLSDAERELLLTACRAVPLTKNEYVATDFVMALFDTVLDYQNHVETIRKAGDFFREHCWDEIRTLDDLEEVLERYPDDRTGNDELAQYLWGNHHWTRAGQLRGLVVFFAERGITDLDSLGSWANASSFADFGGRIKGLGPAVYQWLVMRSGVETIKPDVHILRFVSRVVARPVYEREAVESLEWVAKQLGVSARTLDWSLWEFQRGGGAIGASGGGSVATPRTTD
jgi:hypothetical protein